MWQGTESILSPKQQRRPLPSLLYLSLFYGCPLDSDSDCKQCTSVLQELEHIDDDAEVAGIPIVKLEDRQLAKTVGVFALPAIVFFRWNLILIFVSGPRKLTLIFGKLNN